MPKETWKPFKEALKNFKPERIDNEGELSEEGFSAVDMAVFRRNDLAAEISKKIPGLTFDEACKKADEIINESRKEKGNSS
jgi:hypothetical protein